MHPIKLSLELFDKDDLFVREDELRKTLLTLLRFHPLTQVDQLIEEYTHVDTLRKLVLLENYANAKREYLNAAPYCSRYSYSRDLQEINYVYQNAASANWEVVALNDLAYGKKRSDLAKMLLELLNDANTTIVPDDSRMAALPSSSTGTRRFAKLVEQVGKWLHENNKNEKFGILRTQEYAGWTKMDGRYTWGSNVVYTILFNSSLHEIRQARQYYDRFDRIKYFLYYKNKQGTYLRPTKVHKAKGYTPAWFNGNESVEDTWSDMEDLFEMIWSMDVSKPNNSNESSLIDYEKKLTAFYLALTRLVWLIGDTQPLLRGSGSIAEIVLAIAHEQHKLQAPILKLQFPQLDILNISFPLKDYLPLFPYFFEPSTIPAHLRPDSEALEGLSQGQLLSWLYQKLNATQERQNMLLVKARLQVTLPYTEKQRKKSDLNWIQRTSETIENILKNEMKAFYNSSGEVRAYITPWDKRRYEYFHSLYNTISQIAQHAFTQRKMNLVGLNWKNDFRTQLDNAVSESLTNKLSNEDDKYFTEFEKACNDITISIIRAFSYFTPGSPSFFSVANKTKDPEQKLQTIASPQM